MDGLAFLHQEMGRAEGIGYSNDRDDHRSLTGEGVW